MLYKDNEYINECNYKIHYDNLIVVADNDIPNDLQKTYKYKDQIDNNPAEYKYIYSNSIYEDTFYTTNNNIKLFIIHIPECVYKDNGSEIVIQDILQIKSFGKSGTVIKKIAPRLYKYIKIL